MRLADGSAIADCGTGVIACTDGTQMVVPTVRVLATARKSVRWNEKSYSADGECGGEGNKMWQEHKPLGRRTVIEGRIKDN